MSIHPPRSSTKSRSTQSAARAMSLVLLATLSGSFPACDGGTGQPTPSTGGMPGDGGECVGDTCDDGATPSCADQGCSGGFVCTSSGACIPGGSDIDVDGAGGSRVGAEGGESGMGGDLGCIDIQVAYEEEIPTVALLIDRSNSMDDSRGYGDLVDADINDGSYRPWGCPMDPSLPPETLPQTDIGWRWNVARNVLFHPSRGLVPAFEDRVRFGMMLYTYQSTVTPEICPELIEVDFGLGNSEELLAAMHCSDLGKSTPTRESLTLAAQALSELELGGPKAIVLATDGAPNSCACPRYGDGLPVNPPECIDSVVRDGESMSPAEAEVYDLVQEAGRIHEEWGIVISVVDLSSEGEIDFHQTLEDVATAGGGQLYDGLTPTGLSDSLFELVGESRSCVVNLQGKIASGYEDRGRVFFDGEPLDYLTRRGEDGYVVTSSSSIELSGQPCTGLKQGKHALDISFPCEFFEVVR